MSRPASKTKRIHRPQQKDDWWKIAPDLVRVNIATGEVTVFRWPIYERIIHEYPEIEKE